MGDLNLTALRDETWLSLEHHTDADPSVVANATRLDRWINQAYRRTSLPTTFPHPELQAIQTLTLVAGTQSYALASTRWAIDHIRHPARNRNLKRSSKEALDRLNFATTGEPISWARWANTIFLSRTPGTSEAGQTLDIYTWDIPVALTGTNTTVLRAIFDEPIIELAAAIGWRRLGDFARSDAHRETYAVLINDIRTLDAVEGKSDHVGIDLPDLRMEYMVR